MGRAHLASWMQSCLALVGGAALLLFVASGGGANGVESQFVQAVETATEGENLQVRVITTSPEPPVFSAFPLREPDRLVMDFRDYVWEPGLTGHLESSHPQVTAVRVGQFSKDPPITRVVFDLAVPASEVEYRPDRSSDGGELSIRVAAPSGKSVAQLPGASTAEHPASKPPAAGASAPSGPGPDEAGSQTRPPDSTSTSVASASAAPLGAPEPSAPEAAGQAAQTNAQAPASGPVATAPAGPRPVQRAAGISPKSYLPFVLAAVVLIGGFTGLAVWFRRRVRRLRAATRKAARPAAMEGIPGSDLPEQSLSQGAAPAAEPDGTAIRCRIVDGYLVLAPEGSAADLSGLAAAGARKAKVEGSIRLTPMEEVEAAAGEPPAAEGVAQAEASVAGERDDVETAEEDEFVSAAALAAGEGRVDESPLDERDDPASRARELVESLAAEGEEARKRAAEELWRLAENGHADVLVPYLKSDDPRVRLVVAGVVGETRASEFAGPLSELLEDPDPSVRAAVLYAFSQFGEAGWEHTEGIAGRLADEEASVRARAVEALAAVAPGDEGVAAQAVELAGDREFSVREAATSAALDFARHGAVGPVVALLGDLSRRAQALELLQQADDETLKQLLMAASKAASDPSDVAMGTLAYVVGTRCTAADFLPDLESSDEAVRLAGLEGLALVGGEESRADVERVSRSDSSSEVKQRATQILTYWKEVAATTARAGARSSGSKS